MCSSPGKTERQSSKLFKKKIVGLYAWADEKSGGLGKIALRPLLLFMLAIVFNLTRFLAQTNQWTTCKDLTKNNGHRVRSMCDLSIFTRYSQQQHSQAVALVALWKSPSLRIPLWIYSTHMLKYIVWSAPTINVLLYQYTLVVHVLLLDIYYYPYYYH